MRRKKGTRNTPQGIIKEIVEKHTNGKSTREYKKPYKTIKNIITRENNKKRCKAKKEKPPMQRGRKAAVTLQEYKYENKRLRMENELLRDFLCETGSG